MPATVIVGMQWGDEGKAKVLDALADQIDIVVRFQGGANAGHTVVAISHHRQMWAAADRLIEVREGATDHAPTADWKAEQLTELDEQAGLHDGRSRRDLQGQPADDHPVF